MSLTTSIRARLRAILTGSTDLAAAEAPLDLLAAVDMASGTSSGKADMAWWDSRTIAASGDEDLDLAGSLTGILGGTVTFAKIKAVLIKAAAGNTNDVVISRPADTGVPLFAAAGDSISIGPGGVFLWASPGAGVTVTASTGDCLNIANSTSGTSVDYDVVIIGTSA